jgi:hypothetical protein
VLQAAMPTEEALSPVDQCILLALGQRIKKTNPSNQITTIHEILAHVTRVLSPAK